MAFYAILQFIQKLAQKCIESSLLNKNNKMEAQCKNRPMKQNSAVYYYLTVGSLSSKTCMLSVRNICPKKKKI